MHEDTFDGPESPTLPAIHESGHIVVNAWHGKPFAEVNLFRRDGKWTGVTFYDSRLPKLTLEDQLDTLVAGVEAEALWAKSRGLDGDNIRAMAMSDPTFDDYIQCRTPIRAEGGTPDVETPILAAIARVQTLYADASLWALVLAIATEICANAKPGYWLTMRPANFSITTQEQLARILHCASS
jgi:hypothetical protein